MLKKIYSPVFKIGEEIRPAIEFDRGLNVIMGMSDGRNSIGKSSVLLAIDFVFGGGTYPGCEAARHIGEHDVFSTFEFEGKEYHFVRNTWDVDKICVCTKDYQRTEEVWTKAAFVEWLRKMYKIDIEGISFRETLSSFFRIYGKDNHNERYPLKGTKGNAKTTTEIVIKLYNRYAELGPYSSRFDEEKKKYDAFSNAVKYGYVSKLSGGKNQYEENVQRIKKLEEELETLITEKNVACGEEDIQKEAEKAKLADEKIRIENEIADKNRRLNLVELSLSNGVRPTEADLEGLSEFFPDVNLRKLYEVENYHNKLAAILEEEIGSEQRIIKESIEMLQVELQDVKGKLRVLGVSSGLSKEFLDRYGEIRGEIDALKSQNDSFQKLDSLEKQKQEAANKLEDKIMRILAEITDVVNRQMKEDNTRIDASVRPPELRFKGKYSYVFETPGNGGTGANYKGMLLYDLAVLKTTLLPAMAHDSLLFKNMEDHMFESLMQLYMESGKQIFIAMDKVESYSQKTQEILEKRKVLQLTDGEGSLYGSSWK